MSDNSSMLSLIFPLDVKESDRGGSAMRIARYMCRVELKHR